MGKSRGTGASGVDGGNVDVVREGTAAGGEVGEVDGELNALSSWCSSGADGSLDISTRVGGVEELDGRKCCGIDGANWVVQDGDSITENLEDFCKHGKVPQREN